MAFSLVFPPLLSLDALAIIFLCMSYIAPAITASISLQMGDHSRSKRPKRCSTRRNPEAFLYALSWQEERDIQRAMYKSLKERRLDPSSAKAIDMSALHVEPLPSEPTKLSPRKSPRLNTTSRRPSLEGSTEQTDDRGASSDENTKNTEPCSEPVFEGMKTRQQDKPNRPLLMRASSSSTLEEPSSYSLSKSENISPVSEPNSNPPVMKKRILAPRRSMGEIPVELWVDPFGKPVVTRDFLDFLCYRGSPGLPQKLAWFELAPHKRPQAQLFTTGHRGSSVTRAKVAARDKRTSVSGGLISDSSSNSGGSTGLSRRNSGQSSPSGDDNGTVNGDRRSLIRDTNRPRKKSRSLFYQIMTAKLRRLQNSTIVGKRASKSPVPSPPLPASNGTRTCSDGFKKKAERSSDITRRAATRAALRRSRRVQQQKVRLSRPPQDEVMEKETSDRTRKNVTADEPESEVPNAILTRQRSKDFQLRAKNLRRR